MATNSPNWNILIVGAVVIGGLYFWQKIKSSPSPNTATDYVSGTTGQTISDATQPTIRTDLRNAGRTQRVAQRNPIASDYVSGVTQSNISDASQGTVKTDIRQTASIIKAENRQDTRITLAENRQTTRLTSQTNTIGEINKIGGAVLGLINKPKAVPTPSNTNINANQAVYTRVVVNPYKNLGMSTRFA